MTAIAAACAAGRIGAQVVRVIADRKSAGGIERARALGLATEIVPYADYPDRAGFDARLREAIEASGATHVALAGFMRILTPGFVEAYAGRLLNVHPSLLPKFRGLHTHARALEAQETEHGASIHYVTPELDGGPVILQARLRVVPGESALQLSARVLSCEHVIYPRVIGWIAAGRLVWEGGEPRLDGAPLRRPIVEDFDVS